MSTQELDAQESSKTFDIYMKSKVDGRLYDGRFTTVKLDIGKTIQMGVLKAQYMGGMSNVDLGYQLLAESVALCQVAIINKPAWFNEPLNMRATDVLSAITKEVRSFEGSFRVITTFLDGLKDESSNPGAGRAGVESQSNGSVESPQVNAGSPPTLVDKQVPSISKVS